MVPKEMDPDSATFNPPYHTNRPNVMEEEIVLKRKEFVPVNSDLKEMIVVLSPVLINAVEMGLV